jgi:hypothetical protein
LNVRSISWSKLAKTRVRVGGWGWKFTVPKDIWFPSTFGLLLDKSEKSHQIHASNAQGPHGQRQLTRVNSTNILDEELRIGGRGCRINSKIKIRQTRRNLMRVENKLVDNWLNLNLSLAGLSWPLYIGGQVLRIRSGSIQIIISVYNIISYFDYIYACA